MTPSQPRSTLLNSQEQQPALVEIQMSQMHILKQFSMRPIQDLFEGKHLVGHHAPQKWQQACLSLQMHLQSYIILTEQDRNSLHKNRLQELLSYKFPTVGDINGFTFNFISGAGSFPSFAFLEKFLLQASVPNRRLLPDLESRFVFRKITVVHLVGYVVRRREFEIVIHDRLFNLEQEENVIVAWGENGKEMKAGKGSREFPG
nr:hypothetical protein Iba_chr14dCG15080 [Ipomoea batatas]